MLPRPTDYDPDELDRLATVSRMLRDLDSRIETIDAVVRSAERGAVDPIAVRKVRIMRRHLTRLHEGLGDLGMEGTS